ncbi:MAG: NAD-dependent epimerase/dehydratase family protein [Capsulimonadales bacterium]|nr:NAD-dependent epimerase/dehydratase family protein [Capsulimonadales bacterium]
MKVLFIGGTGLISTAIARQLIAENHEVVCFNRGRSESRLPEGTYQVITGDRRDYATFEKTFDGQHYDVVVDMVAYHPDDTASAIRAFTGKCGQFIHCSTVCVYSGPPQQIPTTETEPYHSIGGYGKNKIACEELLLRTHADSGFPATIMRPSHSYGEGGLLIRPFGPADSFISRVRAGLPVIVPGDGTGLWASCHVDDVARGFIGVMGNDLSLGQAYNITADEWFTWNTYHEQVAEVVGGKYEPVYLPTDILIEVAPKYSGGLKEIFAWTSIFDNAKIKRDTNYTGQTVSWREGVRRTVEWMDAHGKHAAVTPDEYEDQLIAAWKAGVVASLPRQS